ncbi:2593_t:CDS:10 [Diversispora eburnea]|uniref:2593_t:CDS:1 n=1 Tax=Diversispora eburnea TaxID=1213867 RepID=A0A9N8ZFX4_9GLOM|nr:2593_t:CDS:10 [Diversispora eburnea]
MSKINKAHSRVELKIRCKELIRSNAQVFLLIKDQRTKNWTTTSRSTEVIKDDTNPHFVKNILVDYYFEELQELRFIVVHVNKPNQKGWRQQELIGQFEFNLGSLMGCQGRKIQGNLYDPNNPIKKCGNIVIFAEEFVQSKRIVRLQLQVNQMVSKGCSGKFKKKPDLYFRMSLTNEDNTFSSVYESKSIVSENPVWPEFEIPENTLGNGDEHRKLLIEVINKRKSSRPILGRCTLSLNELFSNNKTFQLQSSSSTKKNSGIFLRFRKVSIYEQVTFLDYIAGGIKINLAAAIDFTSSNGNHLYSSSLHYNNPNVENSYQKAISSVGKILEAYDYDKKFPVYGFGAKFNGVLSHVYPLNNDHKHIINHTAQRIRSELDAGNNMVYYVLLIISDGVITDMESTVRAIIKASSLPLSIVIVGVGNADFTKMHKLVADEVPLTDGNSQIERDIVQFVVTEDFQTEYSKYLLPKKVLEEIPVQFLDYMRRNRIRPRPPIKSDIVQLIDKSYGANNDYGNAGSHILCGLATCDFVPSIYAY